MYRGSSLKNLKPVIDDVWFESKMELVNNFKIYSKNIEQTSNIINIFLFQFILKTSFSAKLFFSDIWTYLPKHPGNYRDGLIDSRIGPKTKRSTDSLS